MHETLITNPLHRNQTLRKNIHAFKNSFKLFGFLKLMFVSFSSHAPNLWNSLPIDIRLALTVWIFNLRHFCLDVHKVSDFSNVFFVACFMICMYKSFYGFLCEIVLKVVQHFDVECSINTFIILIILIISIK